MRHDPNRPKVNEVLEDFYRYYQKNPAWGVLHVILDDGNYGPVRGAIQYAEGIGDEEGKRLAEILDQMSPTQQGKIARLCSQRDARERWEKQQACRTHSRPPSTFTVTPPSW